MVLDPPFRGAHRGAVHPRPDRRLLPPCDRRRGLCGGRDRCGGRRRLRCLRPIATTAPRWPWAALPAAVMAELFGKVTGSAHGRGGSMHLLDVERRFYGGWGIVGAHLPIATGAALALEHTDQRGAVLCQFGDGAVATGAFHEALNLAAVWQLPIVFQVINNQYGMGTSVDQSAAEPDLWKRAAAYRMHGERVDGNDLMAVREAASRLLARGPRQSGGRRCWRRSPTGFVATRWPTPARCTARAEEIESWKQRDPITRFGLVAAEQGLLSDGDIEEIWREVNEVVKQAIDESPERCRPRPRLAVRAPVRRCRLAPSSSGGCTPAHRSVSAERASHGRPDLPRGAAASARRRAGPRRVGAADGRGDRPLRRLLQGHSGSVAEVRAAAGARDSDLGGGVCGRRHRRSHDGAAAGDRDHDHQLHPRRRWIR